VSSAGGTVTYTVYSGFDWAHRHVVVSRGPVTVVDGIVPNSKPVVLTSPGTYYWRATYSGDSSNNSSASTFGSETEIVVPVPHCEYGWPWGPRWLVRGLPEALAAARIR
jgi:hypothetical protein